MMKKIYYEKLVDLMEYNMSRSNHITQDGWPLTCSVSAYAAIGQKTLETPGIYQYSSDILACIITK